MLPYACKDKQRKAQRLHYLANKSDYIRRSREGKARHRAAVRDYIAAYLLTHPCVDCGEADPIVLEFDHRDRGQKAFNIGDAQRGVSIAALKLEIAKCDVRCANCHRRKTFYERFRIEKSDDMLDRD